MYLTSNISATAQVLNLDTPRSTLLFPMTLSPKQEQAFDQIINWSNRPEQKSFTLSGFAGTGKTFLMSKILEALGKRLNFCAPTGKAAKVLTDNVGQEALTIHKLLYTPSSGDLSRLRILYAKVQTDPNDTKAKKELDSEKARLAAKDVSFFLKDDATMNGESILVVDEASMVPHYIKSDLDKLPCKILYVGDPGQLPPVKSKDWFSASKPDIFLDEIHRQALDSPIIRLSMEVRAGTVTIPNYREGDCQILRKDEIARETWLEADQVLTGKNTSRKKLNRFFRKQLGRAHSALPLKDDKLICLKNDYDNLPMLINGTFFTAFKDSPSAEEINYQEYGVPVSTINMDYEGNRLSNQLFYPFHCLSTYRVVTEDPIETRRGLVECDYGYAITVHKAQGSGWPFVILGDDGFLKGKPDRRRWLYTAITRAKKKLIIVQA